METEPQGGQPGASQDWSSRQAPPAILVLAAGSPAAQPLCQGAPDTSPGREAAPSPLRVLAELSFPHVVDGTETELIGARGNQALDRHRGSLGVHTGQEHSPGGIYGHRGWRQRWALWGGLLLPPNPSRGPASLGLAGSCLPCLVQGRLVMPFFCVPLAQRGWKVLGEGLMAHRNRDAFIFSIFFLSFSH